MNLSVSATGSGTVTYQWLRKGKAIAGATSATLAITNSTFADSGWYLVDATDGAGTTRSAPLFVLVEPTRTENRYWAGTNYQYSDYDGADDVIAVATGTTQALALKRNGTAQYRSYSGSYNPPAVPTTSDLVAVGVGQHRNVALRGDGTIFDSDGSYLINLSALGGMPGCVDIAVADHHALAIKSDGTVVARGYNTSGQCNVPVGLTGVVAVSASYYNSYALKQDGTLVIWGDSYGGMVAQSGMTDVAGVAACTSHFVALKTDGTVVAFGENYYGQCNVPAGLTNVIAVAAGVQHSAALKADGTVVVWGASHAAITLPSLADVYRISAGGGTTIVIRDASADTAPIVTVPPSTQAATEAQPLSLSVAVTGVSPMTYQWRKNGADITNATSATLSFPSVSAFDAGSYDVVITNYMGSTTSAAGILTVTELPAIGASDPVYRVILPGAGTTLVPTYSGPGAQSYQWFRNGRVLAGATDSSLSLTSATFSDNGYYFADIVDSNGLQRSPPIFVAVVPAKTQVRAWGSAVQSPAIDNIIAIAANPGTGLGLKRNGVVTQLGGGGIPLPVGMSGVVSISGNQRHALALVKDGTVVAWGDNSYGQTTVPVGLSGVVAVSAGSNHSLALKSDGSVVAWGYNAWSQCNVPAGLSHVVGILASDQFSLAIKDDGTVVAWGAYYSLSSVLGSLTSISAVASYPGYHLAFLSQGGTVSVIGGGNEYGQGTTPTGLAQVVAVAAGGFHTVALKDNGTVVSWGRNAEGQATVPENLANVFRVSAGFTSSYAIRDATSDTAPVISSQPASQVKIETGKVTFAVSVTGPGPYTYQWRKNGTAIAGATTPTFKLIDLALSDAGAFDVVITNYVGSTTSATATLTVNAIPVVTTLSPTRQVIASGQSVNLNVSATGTGPLSYQWTHDGQLIAGATNVTLSLTNFTRAAAGHYLVQVTDNIGTRFSAPYFLFFEPGTGPAPLTQLRPWGTPSFGLHNIPAALNDAVDIVVSSYNPLALRANGTVVTWGDNETYYPSPAGLTGVVAIALSDSHRAAVKSDGTVVAWGDNSYKQCDVPAGLVDVVSVACGNGYTLALKADGTVVGWGGQYTNQVPNNPAYVQNVPAGLKNVVAILALPSQGLALRSDGTVVTWWGSPWDPGLLIHEEYSDVIAVTGTTRYGLLKRDGTVQVVPNNYYDNVPYVPPGLNNVVALHGAESLFAVKADGSVVGWHLSSAVELPDGIPHVIKITDMYNGGLVLRDASADAPPVLSTLTDRTQVEGQPVSWSCAAAGTGPFTYQWRKNGANIASATGSTLTLPSVLPADAGSYDLVVTNYKGVTTSNAVVLTVLPLPVFTAISPTRQVFDPGQTMTLNVAATGTGPLTYQWFHNGHAIPGANSTGFSATNLSLQDGGWYLVDVTDNNGKRRSQSMFVVVAPTVTKVHVWGDYVDKLLALKPAYTDIISVSLSSDGRFAYGLRRNGTVVNWGEPNGSALPPVPAGLTDVVAIQVDGLIALKSDGTVVSIGNQPSANADVLAGLRNVVSIEGSNGVSFALKYDGTVVAWSPDVTQRDVTNVPAGLDHVVALAAGSGYALALKDNGTVVGWGVSNYPDLPGKAIPSDLTDVIAINAGAGGIALRSGGLVTQWGWNGRHDYPAYTHWPVDVDDTLKIVYNDGEISPQDWEQGYSYTTPQPKNVKNLYKIVRRGSAVLALSGESAPLVTLDPVSVTQREAQKVMLAVAATGLEPLTFQWRKNGTAITGATSATLIFDEVAPADAGGYDAVITNSLGSATSKAATLTVIPVPVITSLSPTRNVMNTGQDFSLNVAATGTGALNYQWSRNGKPIVGGTNASLPLPSLAVSDGGWYLVNISDDNGTRRSPPIFLTVVPPLTKVTAWGSSYEGRTAIPAELTGVIAVAAGDAHALALKRDGTVVGWGSTALDAQKIPAGLSNVVALAAGYYASLALRSDGTVVGWGLNDAGQTSIPAGLKDVVAIAIDGHHSLALKSNGTVVAWGDNYYRQSTVPTTGKDIVAIAAGAVRSYELDRDGHITMWGDSNNDVSATIPATAIDAGGSYSIFLFSDGTVSWSGTSMFPANILPPVGLNDVIAVAASDYHAVALKSNGTLVGWGYNVEESVIPPAGLTNVFAITAGFGFSFALSEVKAPVILTQPASQTVIDGSTITLTVAASGIPVPSYQWRKNGLNISGATISNLIFSNPNAADAGSYTVVVSNEVGSVVSNPAKLVVDTPMPAAFDMNAYLARYPDVAAVFGTDHRGAWLYYLNQGIYQGEVFDDLFRVEEYLSLYPDLATLFGSDLGGALMHWLTEGSIEGRLGRIPQEFKAQGYFDRNPDVAAAVGNDPILAWGHYWLYGIYEGRAYDDELRVFEYLAINADLTAAFVNDWRQAALHWMRYGRTEGRLGRLPLTFNVSEYLVRSPDVAAVWGTNPTTVFLHYWIYGIDESRTYDDLFRPNEYLVLNPDLAAALGTDRRLAFKHWVRYGRTEGRPGKNP